MKKLYVLLVVFSLLFFGCVGGANEELTTTNLTNATAGPQADGESNGYEGENEGNEGDGFEIEETGEDYSQMDFSELIELKTPLECVVTNEDGTGSTMDLKGGKIRIETALDPEYDYSYDCQVLVQIVNVENYTSYMGCKENAPVFPGTDCDWYLIEADPSVWGGSETYPEGSGPSEGVDTNVLKQLPPGSFFCVPGTFGDERFETPGNVCTIIDIMTGAGY